mmetsp:Transcript_9830/g.24889  ORF Transcript_9830/g.24889 Transcript_9830/m.24889 type:complete len:236 (+) Transcript_9830:358-1065(+)
MLELPLRQLSPICNFIWVILQAEFSKLFLDILERRTRGQAEHVVRRLLFQTSASKRSLEGVECNFRRSICRIFSVFVNVRCKQRVVEVRDSREQRHGRDDKQEDCKPDARRRVRRASREQGWHWHWRGWPRHGIFRLCGVVVVLLWFFLVVATFIVLAVFVLFLFLQVLYVREVLFVPQSAVPELVPFVRELHCVPGRAFLQRGCDVEQEQADEEFVDAVVEPQASKYDGEHGCE